MSELLTLFMYFYEGKEGHKAVPFYARDEAHATLLVRDYLQKEEIIVKQGSELRPYPDGFLVHHSTLPGNALSE